jgi:hypothetical protein
MQAVVFHRSCELDLVVVAGASAIFLSFPTSRFSAFGIFAFVLCLAGKDGIRARDATCASILP